MTDLIDGTPTLTNEILHAQLTGVCCCGICAARSVTDYAAQAAMSVTDGGTGASVATMPAIADILSAMQFDLENLSDDTLNTSADPAFDLTYQFGGSSQPVDWPTDTGGNYIWGEWSGWRPFSTAEQDAVRAAMDQIEAAVNVTFTEVTGDPDPDINLGLVTIPGETAGFGGFTYSATSIDNGVTWDLANFDAFALFDETVDLTSAQNLLLHELGHALTLRHPFGESPTLPEGLENNKYTVMSYTPNPDTGTDADTLQLFDMLALQERWGANLGTATRGDRYTGPDGASTLTIWDGGSRSDWLEAKTSTVDVVLNLNPGEFSQFTGRDDVVIGFGVEIEHARGGSGDDVITGNDMGNKLYGGRGDDVMYGGLGKDKMIGNNGADIMYGGYKADDLNGGKGNDWLYGENQRDVLFGSNGRDRLDGGQADDILEGGRGNDTFYFREGGDMDTIIDFTNDRDRVLFEIDGVTTRFQAAQYATQDGNDVVYDFGGGDVLRILNMTVADMADDFNVI